jgi:hypothetical protein
MSYKPEVIADNSGKLVSNALCFATEREAQLYVADLKWRWTLVRETRVVASDDPVNHAWTNERGAKPIEAAPIS